LTETHIAPSLTIQSKSILLSIAQHVTPQTSSSSSSAAALIGTTRYLGDHLKQSINWLQHNNVTASINSISKKQILPNDLSQFVNLFGHACPKRLQYVIWARYQRDAATKLRTHWLSIDRNSRDVARLDACSQKYAGLWLSTLPRSAGMALDDISFRIAVCLRLGINPFYYEVHSQRIRCKHHNSNMNSCRH